MSSNEKIKIEIDAESGFCFGVVTAIQKAEQELSQQDQLYCLGDIVHNSEEVARLSKQGLVVIEHDQIQNLHNTKLLFRAHGEPPYVYEQARANGVEIIDATCPVVLALQKRIRKAYQAHPEAQIVIYGKKGHAEVNGLVGQTEGKAIVIESDEDLAQINYEQPIYLFSQTTKSLSGFQQLVQTIQEKVQAKSPVTTEAEGTGASTFVYYDTICRQVANRMDHIRKFAKEHDLIFFVSGKKSSNGKVLYQECKKQNPRTFFVSHPDEVQPETMLGHAQSIGICGATSTPKWQMEAVQKKLINWINNVSD